MISHFYQSCPFCRKVRETSVNVKLARVGVLCLSLSLSRHYENRLNDQAHQCWKADGCASGRAWEPRAPSAVSSRWGFTT